MAIICHMGQSGALRGVVGDAQIHVYLSEYISIVFATELIVFISIDIW
jgi:hypothetical protein